MIGILWGTGGTQTFLHLFMAFLQERSKNLIGSNHQCGASEFITSIEEEDKVFYMYPSPLFIKQSL